jgi:hypothetical protein
LRKLNSFLRFDSKFIDVHFTFYLKLSSPQPSPKEREPSPIIILKNYQMVFHC